MKLRIDHCYYELIKDLLISNDSLIKSVEKIGDDTLVILQEGKTQFDLTDFLSQEPLFQYTKFSTLHTI